MTDASHTSPTPALLDDYLTVEQLVAQTNKSERTWREWRQKQIGPPYVMFGNTVLYPREGFRAWLKSIEKTPRQRGGRAA